MAEHNKHTRDPGFVSDEPWEIESIQKQFPGRSHQAVENALASAKRDLGGSEDRDRIMALVRQKLG